MFLRKTPEESDDSETPFKTRRKVRITVRFNQEYSPVYQTFSPFLTSRTFPLPLVYSGVWVIPVRKMRMLIGVLF